MTAQPQIPEFSDPRTPTLKQPVFMRANVTEHFWGFEVRPNEQVFDIAVLMRAMTGFFAGTAFIAALGVWLLPSMAFVATAFSSKMTVSILLMFATVLLARVAARGTQVRVQLDTSTGELREVVDGAFGGDLVLATYGLDAVEAVEVIESRENRGFGQIQIRVRGAGVMSAWDGAISALAMLRSCRTKHNFHNFVRHVPSSKAYWLSNKLLGSIHLTRWKHRIHQIHPFSGYYPQI